MLSERTVSERSIKLMFPDSIVSREEGRHTGLASDRKACFYAKSYS